MPDFKKLLKQYWQVGFLAVVAIILFTLISATGGDPRQVGSSYSIGANGYGAWYQMMVDRGVKIQRWEQPFDELAKSNKFDRFTTLLQVNSQLIEQLSLASDKQEWVEKGNTLIILGVAAPASGISFKTDLESQSGTIRIETTRRFRAKFDPIYQSTPDIKKTNIISDKSGGVITEFTLGKGRLILSTTPSLAANVYQDFKPNYELLAKLTTGNSQQLIVDEYIHGYRKQSTKIATKKGDVFDYLRRTPLSIVLLNLGLITLVIIWQKNRRFGKIVMPKLPEIENSEAYIQALAGILHQANSSEFVIQNIGKTQQLSWQQKLGLGTDRLVEATTLITAWENQTKLPTDDLQFVLKLVTEARRLTPKELNIWLIKVQTISSQI